MLNLIIPYWNCSFIYFFILKIFPIFVKNFKQMEFRIRRLYVAIIMYILSFIAGYINFNIRFNTITIIVFSLIAGSFFAIGLINTFKLLILYDPYEDKYINIKILTKEEKDLNQKEKELNKEKEAFKRLKDIDFKYIEKFMRIQKLKKL